MHELFGTTAAGPRMRAQCERRQGSSSTRMDTGLDRDRIAIWKRSWPAPKVDGPAPYLGSPGPGEDRTGPSQGGVVTRSVRMWFPHAFNPGDRSQRFTGGSRWIRDPQRTVATMITMGPGDRAQGARMGSVGARGGCLRMPPPKLACPGVRTVDPSRGSLPGPGLVTLDAGHPRDQVAI